MADMIDFAEQERRDRMYASNATLEFAPLTLNHSWPTLHRLMAVVAMCAFGSIMNGFFFASFFVQEELKRRGNIFLACAGLADMIVTSAIMPVVSVLLLSGQWDTLVLCHVMYFMGQVHVYCYTLYYTMAALESFIRMCCKRETYDAFLALKLEAILVIIPAISCSMAAFGVYYELDYDYCLRIHTGNLVFRIVMLAIVYVLGVTLTIFGFGCSFIKIRLRASRPRNVHYRRSHLFVRDRITNNLNLLAYLLHIGAWLPYVIVVYGYPDSSNKVYYYTTWLALCRPLVTSSLYMFDSKFRHAYSHLFYYCCCQSAGLMSTRQRSDTRPEYHVHLMHHAVNLHSPPRAQSSVQETMEL